MKLSLNSFTSRMVLGELAIHLFLVTLVFIVVLPLVEGGYKNQFVRHIDNDAQRLATYLLRETDRDRYLREVVEGGQVISAALVPWMKRQSSAFHEDSDFGQGGDHAYNLAIPLTIDGTRYSLRLSYDERPTEKLIAATYERGLVIALAYILLAVSIASVMGPELTRPLQQLRKAARKIASGLSTERLQVETSVSEIRALADDLERMRAELVAQRETVAAREANIRAIMDNVVDALFTIDSKGRIQSFNMAAERMFGHSADTVLSQHIDTLFAEPLFGKTRAQLHPIEPVEQHELLGRRSDGSTFHAEVAVSEMCQLEGSLYIVICRDISERKQAEMQIQSLQEDLERRVVKRTRELAAVNKELQYQALHDALTDLPNRVLLQDRLQQAIRAARREHHTLALLIMDLDRFKEINDTLGHHYGDLLLQQVAVRMRSALRDSDTVARLGGDEFAVLLPSVDTRQQATQAAAKIAEAMETPFTLESQQFHVGISIGIAMYPEHGEDYVTLMRRADVAMYVAKRGQTRHAFYDPTQDINSADRLAMVGELRRAIEQRQLVLHYQPTLDLSTQQIVSVEALLRWEHPDKGTIAPEHFIPLAEQTGLIKPLTHYVLDEALSQMRIWLNTGLELGVSVNLSARNLHDPALAQQVADYLNRWQVPHHLLQLEITESAIMEDPQRAMDNLRDLSAMGIRLSIDDFGTGYSSLAYLKQMPVNVIKIDKSFVTDMLDNNEDRVIVRSTIDLAHNMGHRVIAEGVSSERVMLLLHSLGCDLAQGYYISPPLSALCLRQWLSHSSWRLATAALKHDETAVNHDGDGAAPFAAH